MIKFNLPCENFEIEKVQVKHSNKVSPEYIQNLYLSVGWQFRDAQDISDSIKKSLLLTTAWYNEMLIAIGRATGDGIFNATIWDVAVMPAYQNQGVGKLIINSMLTKLDDYGIPLITLYSECAKKNFYSKLGFECNFNKVIGMYRYKKNL